MNNERGCYWITNGLSYEPTGAMPCCRYKLADSDLHTKDIDKYFQNIKNNKDINYKNLSNLQCKKCSAMEKLSNTSLRTEPFLFYEEPDFLKSLKIGEIVNLQVSFSNFCNFKCRYCSPELSTEWNNDVDRMKQLDLHKQYRRNTSDKEILMTATQTMEHEKEFLSHLEKQDLSKLRLIAVFGGEPFMARHFEDFLELLERKTDISKLSMQINTNSSIFPNQQKLDVFSRFKGFDIRSSIESTGKLAEYVRKGLVWNTFEKNVYKWKDFANQNPNTQYRLHMATNIYTINKILDFDKWIENVGVPVKSEYVYTNDMDTLKILSHNHLEILKSRISNIKNQEIRTHLEKIFTSKNWEKYDVDRSKHLEIFKNNSTILDTIRSEKLKDVNLELYNWTYNT